MPAKGNRLVPVNRQTTILQKKLHEAIGTRSVQAAADEMGVPYWVLRDTLRGATDCPRAIYLPSMARWLTISIEELINAAYTPLEPASVA